MDREERLRKFDELQVAQEPFRAAHREWRAAYETESSAAFASLDYQTRLKLVFHVFRMLAHDVGSYRYLVYDKLGFGMDAYAVLMDGLDINNALVTERDRPDSPAEVAEDIDAATIAMEEYEAQGGEDAAAWLELQATDRTISVGGDPADSG